MENNRFISQKQFDLISETEATFLLEHGEKKLQDTVDTNQLITDRTTLIFTILVGMIIGILGYAISKFEKLEIDILGLLAIELALYFIWIVWSIDKNIKPRSYFIVGAPPKIFFNDKVFNEHNNDKRLKQLLVNEILECQKRINANDNTNAQKWAVFNRCLKDIKRTPWIMGGSYFAAKAISCLLL